MPRRGQRGEDIAADFLENNGHKIITRNYHCHRGEIDIISIDDDYVVFTEVKQRGKNSYLQPEEAITYSKKKRLINCAERWFMENEYTGGARIDVIAISDGEIRHYMNALHSDGY